MLRYFVLVAAMALGGCAAGGIVAAEPCATTSAYDCRSVYSSAPGFGLQVSMVDPRETNLETVANVIPGRFGYSVVLPADGADLFIADKSTGEACHLSGDVFVDWPSDSNSWTVTASGTCKAGSLAGTQARLSVFGSSFR